MRTLILLTTVIALGVMGVVVGQDEARPAATAPAADETPTYGSKDDFRSGGGKTRSDNRNLTTPGRGFLGLFQEMRQPHDVFVDVNHNPVQRDSHRDGEPADGARPGEFATEPDDDTTYERRRELRARFGGGGGGMTLGRRRRDDDDDERRREQEIRIQHLTRGLKEAPVDQREQIAADLKQELSNLFDVRTAEREAQINALEERLQSLRDQLNKRVEVKDEIIQLRLQTLINEANGLTF